MLLGDANAVAHDVNDFGNVPAKIVIIRPETVAQPVLNPFAQIQANFPLEIIVTLFWVERLVWEFGFYVL